MSNKRKIIPQKHDPIIWERHNKPSLDDFLNVANGIGHTHVIYVQDAIGESRSIWSCHVSDLMGCFETFSTKYYFGRIQPLSLALTFGFEDQAVTDVRPG